jgi:DNA-directed RNA polymerase beta subunit
MSSTKQNTRINFGKIKHLAEAPDLLEVQIQSFKDFFQLETTPDKRNNEGVQGELPDHRHQEYLRAGVSGLFH